MAFNLILHNSETTFKFMQRPQNNSQNVGVFKLCKSFFIDSSELQGDKLVKFAL